MFTAGPLFLEIWKDLFGSYRGSAFTSDHALYDLFNLQGGTDSGKTVAAMQVLTTIARKLKAPPPTDDPYIVIVNKSVPDSKKGAYAKFQELVQDNGYILNGIKDWNKGDRTIEWHTGWKMRFDGAIDEQTAKQGKQQILFCNEVNGLTWPILWQYLKRTRGFSILDYNPSAPFFVHDQFLDSSGAALPPEHVEFNLRVRQIISDHRHNPFLSQRDHDKTENIKDPEYWNVYARGCTGNLVGTVYTDWTMVPDSEFPWTSEKLIAGVDYGHVNDPTALVLVAIEGNRIFVHELCYEPGIGASIVRDMIRAKGLSRIYSEHDIQMIKQLRRLGLHVTMAYKGPGSVAAGILKLKEYKVHYTQSSKNLIEELKRYEWGIDDETKKPTNEPKDSWNHLLDAVRYAVYTKFMRG